MKRWIVPTFWIAFMLAVTALAVPRVLAQHGSSSYALISSAFGGVESTPRVAGDYSLIGASDPNAQQPLSGGNYSLGSAHPGLLSRMPGTQPPDEQQPDEEQPNEEQPGDERPDEEQPDDEQPHEEPENEMPGTLFIPAVER